MCLHVHAGRLTKYSIKVDTSDMPQAMANVHGFAVLHGPSCSSREVLLTQQSGSTFQPGSEDTWVTADMQDLGALQKLTIGLKEQVRSEASLHHCVDASLFV